MDREDARGPGPRAGRGAASPALAVAAAVLLALLALPLAALALSTSPADVLAGLADPRVAPAARLSLVTATASAAVVATLGTPLAWFLSRARGRLAGAVEVLVGLPVVLPPSVAGVALLLAFGRRGVIGRGLEALGAGVAFTPLAVVLAQLFVAAPFFVQAATAAFRRLEPAQLDAARVAGASPARVLFAVAIPLARPGLVAGAAMAWARALGEFGATLMFAGNLEGVTQTLPLAILAALEADPRAAKALSLALLAGAAALLAGLRALAARDAGR